MDKSTLSSLASFSDQLLHFYEAVPAAYKHWSPPSWEGIPSEAFTAIEQICHVCDIEIDGYQVRFQRALNEVNPPLESLDGYRFAKERDYASSNAAEVIADFRAARAKTMQFLSNLQPRLCSTHSASCVVQKAARPIIWTALAEVRLFEKEGRLPDGHPEEILVAEMCELSELSELSPLRTPDSPCGVRTACGKCRDGAGKTYLKGLSRAPTNDLG